MSESYCTHHIECANASGVYRCECGLVYYTQCARCSRIIRPESNAALFESSHTYRLSCAQCHEIFCLEHANTLLFDSGKSSGGADAPRLLCYGCRAGGTLTYEDEAAAAFLLHYHCSYIDRSGRVCSYVSTHPRQFASRAEAREASVAYVPTILDQRAEPELVEQACRHLHANFSRPETTDMMQKEPGFTVRAEIAGALGPGLHVLVVCKTVRAGARIFDFEINA